VAQACECVVADPFAYFALNPAAIVRMMEPKPHAPMTPEQLSLLSDPAWYCLLSRPKSEHLAAAHLRKVEGVETFCPRLRFRRVTTRGRVWFTEALFPGYLFARFVAADSLGLVRYSTAVTGVLHFAGRVPVISDSEVAHLRSLLDEDETKILDEPLCSGEEVEIASGPLRGFHALVTRVLPARERVKILLEFLGQQREVEISMDVIDRQRRPRWSE